MYHRTGHASEIGKHNISKSMRRGLTLRADQIARLACTAAGSHLCRRAQDVAQIACARLCIVCIRAHNRAQAGEPDCAQPTAADPQAREQRSPIANTVGIPLAADAHDMPGNGPLDVLIFRDLRLGEDGRCLACSLNVQ